MRTTLVTSEMIGEGVDEAEIGKRGNEVECGFAGASRAAALVGAQTVGGKCDGRESGGVFIGVARVREIGGDGGQTGTYNGGRFLVQIAVLAVLGLNKAFVVAKHLPAREGVCVATTKPSFEIAWVRLAGVMASKVFDFGDDDDASDAQAGGVVLGRALDLAVAHVAVVFGTVFEVLKFGALLSTELKLQLRVRQVGVVEHGATMNSELVLETERVQLLNATQRKHG
eukprot:3357455-Pleurochrysis_carterae.AAC.3